MFRTASILCLAALLGVGCKKSPTIDCSISEGLTKVKKDGQSGLIDSTGKWVVEARYDEMIEPDLIGPSEGLIPAKTKGKWVYLNEKGAEVITVGEASLAAPFSSGLAVIQTTGGEYFFIDKTGQRVLGPFSFAGSFNSGIAQATPVGESSCGYIDKTGKFVIPPAFERCLQFHGGVGVLTKTRVDNALATTNVIIAPSLKPITLDEFDEISLTDEGPICVRRKGKSYFLKRDGTPAFPGEFDSCDTFSEGLAPISTGSAYGYIDLTGKTVIAPKPLVGARSFVGGLAPVRYPEGDKRNWGFIGRDGNERLAVDPKYRRVTPFKNGLSTLMGDESLAFMNRCGKVVYEQPISH